MTRLMQVTILGAVLSMAGVAKAAPSSGMLLGVYAFSNWQGLRITGTIPGYSAHGKLYKNDVLLRATADGVNVYDVKNHWQIEHAKDQIGPYTLASLEVFRPGQGLTYFWVEFRPVGGVAAKSYNGAPVQMTARILTEQERPGARELFQGKTGARPLPSPNGGQKLATVPNTGNPASLFGR